MRSLFAVFVAFLPICASGEQAYVRSEVDWHGDIHSVTIEQNNNVMRSSLAEQNAKKVHQFEEDGHEDAYVPDAEVDTSELAAALQAERRHGGVLTLSEQSMKRAIRTNRAKDALK